MGYQSSLCLRIELINTICSVGLTLLRGLRSATVSGGESERTYLELRDSSDQQLLHVLVRLCQHDSKSDFCVGTIVKYSMEKITNYNLSQRELRE